MKSIAKLYIAYLELIVIGMVLSSLAVISISGFAYRRNGVVPAGLSVITLLLIIAVSVRLPRVAGSHPEFKRKPFGKIRLFLFLLKEKVLKIIGPLGRKSQGTGLQQIIGGVTALLVLALTVGILWSAFSISADIAVRKNQVIAEAMPGIPATLFSKSLEIDVVGTSETEVSAIIKSEGYPEM